MGFVVFHERVLSNLDMNSFTDFINIDHMKTKSIDITKIYSWYHNIMINLLKLSSALRHQNSKWDEP